MKTDRAYEEKFSRLTGETPLRLLPAPEREFIRKQATRYRFTLQELKQVTEIALELQMWNEGTLCDLWPRETEANAPLRERKKRIVSRVQERWMELKSSPNHYPADFPKPGAGKLRIVAEPREGLGLGHCPVASTRTRCCNLLTLDAVESCGFDCSYCSIQSFYQGEQIGFDASFGTKLEALEIDPNRLYHIGTGQASDSLMWGNRQGLVDALIRFARKHPNVILELKTKSRNIAYLLEQQLPANLICTWSLNTPTIIAHEEHLTASLESRLAAARRVADKGVLVGFHLHPMVHYDHWQEEYSDLFRKVLTRFEPAEVAMVSLGTLTFTRSVIRRIRSRDFKTKILRMPLTDADGKLSYPADIKQAMFSHAYGGLEAWHGQVFFYLCMENHRLWRPVFGYDYPSNQVFEEAMKFSYLTKIEGLRKRRNSAEASCPDDTS